MNIYSITTQEILDRISRHCPEAMYVYLQCINRASDEGNLFLSKEQVEIDLSDSWRHYCNNIKKLARENLLEWHPFNDGISITLAELDFEDHE